MTGGIGRVARACRRCAGSGAGVVGDDDRRRGLGDMLLGGATVAWLGMGCGGVLPVIAAMVLVAGAGGWSLRE